MHLQLEDLLGLEKWQELQQTRKKEVVDILVKRSRRSARKQRRPMNPAPLR